MTPMRRYEQNWLPSIFNDLFDDDIITRRRNTTSPAINVIENEDSYAVEVATPGMTKEDFKIQITEDNLLVVSMEKKQETKDEKKKYLRREFSYTKFEQTLILPDDVKKEEIAASMKDGVLNIELPKIKECERVAQAKQIEIQ